MGVGLREFRVLGRCSGVKGAESFRIWGAGWTKCIRAWIH